MDTRRALCVSITTMATSPKSSKSPPAVKKAAGKPVTSANTTPRKPRYMKNKRAEENKAIRREALRQELQAREYLRQLELIDAEFGEINQTIKALRPATSKAREAALQVNRKNGLELDKADTRIKALKERANLNFRRLNKVLPDLKAVELSDPEGKNPFANLLEAMRISIDKEADEE